MPYNVTTHSEMHDALRPDAFYPQIQSNGPVSTDDSDGASSEEDDSEPKASRGQRRRCRRYPLKLRTAPLA
ncbi:unnamed protein product [Mesocestoides corti]|uniref:Uncharacterized protein n=1 Tax=Mesocestoides corti TaxID=53468 RepID=A0A0R3UDI2_MESCO|nr:unnamed protein product [Mesocestoides corti]